LIGASDLAKLGALLCPASLCAVRVQVSDATLD